MNVLMISFSVNGSMGDNFKMVARDLSKLCNVSVLTNEGVRPDDVGTERICNIRFDRRKMVDFINPVSYCRIYRYIKETVFDVCFIYSSHPVNLFIYHIVNHKRIIPFVHDHRLHSGVGRLDSFFLKANLKYSYTKSAKIVVSCHAIKDDILRLGLMPDREKIAVNYLGLLENLVYSKRELEQDIDVLFFGRIEYYKGLDVLIQAGRKMQNVRFVVAGKGDVSQVFGIGDLPPNIEHINQYVPDDKLAELIQRSKVVVMPYRDATGTQTVQSIFYYKKPIVATNVGCFPEYIEDGVDGIIVPALDAMALRKAVEKLLNNDELRRKMGKNGSEKLIEKFSNDDIARKYISIFTAVGKQR